MTPPKSNSKTKALTPEELDKLEAKAKWSGWDHCAGAEVVLSLIEEIRSLQDKNNKTIKYLEHFEKHWNEFLEDSWEEDLDPSYFHQIILQFKVFIYRFKENKELIWNEEEK